MYLVVSNISKRNNIRSLLQTAAAFGCVEVFVVGQRTFDFDVDGNDVPKSLVQHIVREDMPIARFEKWNDCVEYLKERNIALVGVEIHEDAQNIDEFWMPNKSVAFLMGNEGQGIHEKHMASCDAFCKISQYGGGTASLNVNVAASIVLHRYHLKLLECNNTT
jgi:tRNA G18 (ribose-2'-O)-methylase SpoU